MVSQARLQQVVKGHNINRSTAPRGYLWPGDDSDSRTRKLPLIPLERRYSAAFLQYFTHCYWWKEHFTPTNETASLTRGQESCCWAYWRQGARPRACNSLHILIGGQIILLRPMRQRVGLADKATVDPTGEKVLFLQYFTHCYWWKEHFTPTNETASLTCTVYCTVDEVPFKLYQFYFYWIDIKVIIADQRGGK